MDSAFLLQLMNCLILCWLGTEFSLSRGRADPLRRPLYRTALVSWAILNALVAFMHLEPNLLPRSSLLLCLRACLSTLFQKCSEAIDVPLVLMNTAVQLILGPEGISALAASAVLWLAAAGIALRWGLQLGSIHRHLLTWGCFFLTWTCLWSLARASGRLQASTGVALAIRFLVTAFAYYLVCFWDLRRRQPDLQHAEVAKLFAFATLQTIFIMPLLILVIASCFMGAVIASEFIGLPTAWLNWPIYYCTLYGPWAAIYVLAKRKGLENRLLPW